MIAGILHQGSGLGNQLHRYVMARTLATDRGLEFGMVNPEAFKGSTFMNLYMGKPVPGELTVEMPSGKVFIDVEGFKLFEEKKVVENGLDIRSYDPEINFVEDNTIIDGEFQDERYFSHRLYEINKWLKVEFIGMPEDLCVIGLRGGEFTGIPELFLPKEYWEKAIDEMLKVNYQMKFICVTDDPITARAILPSFVQITHDIGKDWRMIRYAAYSIIANSSFYILPSLLNRHASKIIAPRYWARPGSGTWATPQNYYRRFSYI